jgi:hypothetical protein
VHLASIIIFFPIESLTMGLDLPQALEYQRTLCSFDYIWEQEREATGGQSGGALAGRAGGQGAQGHDAVAGGVAVQGAQARCGGWRG